MVNVERFGVDPATERELSFVQVAAPEQLTADLLPPRPFACLLAWNVSGLAAPILQAAARTLIEAGCAYVCAFGSQCTRIDDAVGDECVELQLADGRRLSFVMISWHPDDTPEQVLSFLLENTTIEDDLEDPDYDPWNAPCRHAVVVDVGGTLDPAIVRLALSAPRDFVRGGAGGAKPG